jgi:hypothetical protein
VSAETFENDAGYEDKECVKQLDKRGGVHLNPLQRNKRLETNVNICFRSTVGF